MLTLLACADRPAPTDSASPCGPAWDPACDELFVDALTDVSLPAALPLPDQPVSVAAGDFAGAGTPQLYIGTFTTVTRLDGDGWATATDIWTSNSSRVYPLVADLTGDGALDLAIGLPSSDDGAGQVVVLAGPAVGPFDWGSPHLELQAADGSGTVLHAADLDADGVLDLAVDAWVKFGPILADSLIGAEGDAGFDARHDAVGDVDGDGVADLVFSYERASEDPCEEIASDIRVVPGPLASGAQSVEEAPIVLSPPEDVILLTLVLPPFLADVHGDGVPDVLAYAASSSGLELLVWAGPVAHGADATARLDAVSSQGGLADIDGDGVDDLVEIHEDAATFRRGPVAGAEACTVVVDERWTGLEDTPDATWLGDLDGDGLADAVFAGAGATGDWVLIRAGR